MTVNMNSIKEKLFSLWRFPSFYLILVVAITIVVYFFLLPSSYLSEERTLIVIGGISCIACFLLWRLFSVLYDLLDDEAFVMMWVVLFAVLLSVLLIVSVISNILPPKPGSKAEKIANIRISSEAGKFAVEGIRECRPSPSFFSSSKTNNQCVLETVQAAKVLKDIEFDHPVIFPASPPHYGNRVVR